MPVDLKMSSKERDLKHRKAIWFSSTMSAAAQMAISCIGERSAIEYMRSIHRKQFQFQFDQFSLHSVIQHGGPVQW